MSASISTKTKSVNLDFLKQTAGYIAGGTVDYFTEAMPNTTSIISDTKSTYNDLRSTLANTTQSILPKKRELSLQQGFRGIMNWFTRREDEFSNGDYESQLEWDDGTTSSFGEAQAQISEIDKAGNQISKTLVETSHKLAEAQLDSTSNITTSIDKQTAAISAGFKRTNDTLDKILEVLTKNTAAIIESSTVGNRSHERSTNDSMVMSGKFSLSDYKKIISQNIKGSELGMAAAFLPMLTDKNMIQSILSPENIVGMLVKGGLNKATPNLKRNMQALDDAVNDTIMSSLIRIGNNNQYNRSLLGKIFGIDASRKVADTSRNTLELKSVPYDTVSKEALTGAIPGYLRKILVALGGDDVIYDYQSRRFVTKNTIKKEFRDKSSFFGSKSYNMGKNVQRVMGNMSNFESMSYELMMNELGSRIGNGGNARTTISSFKNPKEAEKYIMSLYGTNISASDKAKIAKFAKKLSMLPEGFGEQELFLQAAKNNIVRNNMISQYIERANAYGMDLSFIKDNKVADANHIKRQYGRGDLVDRSYQESSIRSTNPLSGKNLVGIDYTNIALYEIYRKLDNGINVYQVGRDNSRDRAFKKYGDRFLPKPYNHRAKNISDEHGTSRMNTIRNTSSSSYNEEDNLLFNNNLEDGSSEDLTRGQRFSRWGKKRGGQLVHAMFNGSPEDVREAFGSIIHDVTEVAGQSVKDGAARINTSFGNVNGYLHHKLFGTEYTYQEGTDAQGKLIFKKVSSDKKQGGIFGWVKDNLMDSLKGSKEKVSKWYSDVAGYFDYGDDPEDKGIAGKRKKLIATSVGAFAGAGLLGGPLGLLIGAVAGNALSATNLGKNIKEKLFGIDKETGESTGLLSKAMDKITRPIQYQVEKTINHFGGALKKGLLGPLSDIGYAIKNRVTDKAESVFGKFFHKVTGALTFIPKKIGQGLGWLAGKTFGGIVGARGETTRWGMSAASTASSGVLGSLAYAIGGKENWQAIHERRKSRKNEIDNERSSFDDRKTWESKKNRSRAARLASLEEYMSEEVKIVEQTNENTAQINDNLSELTYHATHTDGEHSIFTHDHGIHNRLDTMIDILGDISGRPKKGGSSRSNRNSGSTDDEFAGAAISAAATLAASGDDVSNEESRIASGIIDEGGKSKPSKSSISQKLKDLMGIQKKKSDDKNKKEESFLSKLLSGVLDNLPLIAGGILALLALFQGKDGISELLKRIANGASTFTDAFNTDENLPTDASTIGMNAVTSLGGAQVKNKWDWINPFADVYHTSRDGAGNLITNQAMTDAKNAPIKSNIISLFTTDKTLNQRWNTFKEGRMRNKATKSATQAAGYMDAAQSSETPLGRLYNKNKAKSATKKYNKQMQKARDYEATANSAESTLVGSQARNAARIGMLGLGSSVVGGTFELGAKALGVSEEGAEITGNVATAGSAAFLTADMGISAIKGKKSIIDKIIDGIKWIFKTLGEKTKANKLFKKIGADKVAKKIINLGDDVVKAVSTKIDDVVIKKINEKLVKAGLGSVLSVSTAGLATAAGAVGGLLSGACSTEHLFGTLPGDADAGMTAISTILGGLFGALEMSPYGWIVAIFDILDALIMSVPGMEYGMKQGFAQFLYKILGGGASLAEKQESFKSAMDNYNDKFGTNLSISEFNDAVNNGGFFSRLWNGKTEIDSDKNVVTDDAGNILKEGGMKNSIIGNKKKYAKDSSGNVIKSDDGTAVVAKSKYGHTLKENYKFGDFFTIGFENYKRSIFGGDVYKTDENGQALVDENGNYIVDHKEKNLWQKITSGENLLTEETQEALNYAGAEISKFGNKALKSVTDIADSLNLFDKKDDAVIGEDGKPVLDDEGKAVKKNEIGSYAVKTIGKITAAALGPISLINNEVSEWSKKESPWKKAGFKSASEWLAKGMGALWDGFSNIAAGGPDESNIKSTSSISDHSEKEGGNPLNKAFKITSPYGPRSYPHSGMHKGIDLIPQDGSSADVGARFNGTITGVKSNVPDSDTAIKTGSGWNYFGNNSTGNMVTITTDDGLIIKNMHLKAGSIPSNIKEGARVKIGDKLGEMGSTGWSTGAHLHYQIEDSAGNHMDPTSSVTNGTTLSTFKSISNTNHPAAVSSNTSLSSFTNDTSSQTSSGSGVLGNIISALSSFGNELLNAITGGLLGISSNDNTNINTSNNNSLTTNSDLSSESEESIALTNTPNSTWVSIVRGVKKLVADKKPKYSQSNYIDINLNGTKLNVRTDCSGIISAMLKLYGVLPKDGNVTSSSLLKDGTIPSGFDKIAFPGWNNLVEGDILATNGHTEIFASNDGNKHYVYNGGSTSSLGTSGATTSSKTSYQVIWRCRESNASLAGERSIVGSSAPVKVSGEQDIWNYLDKLGYSDIAKAGIMGVWDKETNNKNNRIEGDYLSSFPGFESVLKSNEALNDYTVNKLWPAYKKISINKSAYKGSDGNYYPGIGIAQWTGPRALNLFNYAKSKGMDWKNLDGQMEFFHKEMQDGIRNITPSDMNSQGNASSAAELFARKYEGTNRQDWISARQQSAQRIYNTYTNPNPTDGMGGPEEGRSNINTNTNYASRIISPKKVNTKSSIIKFPSISNAAKNINQVLTGNNDGGTPSTGEIISLLYQVIQQLESINGNTGRSNSLLSTIGQNGIVDKGLRNSLSAIQKTANNRNNRSLMNLPSNPSNSRMITSLARP